MNARAPEHTVALERVVSMERQPRGSDALNAILEYPEGFAVNLSATFNNQLSIGDQGFQILGTEGSLLLGGGGHLYSHSLETDPRG
ncbi:MAG: hypothetical protein U0V70_10155 [Terriglobia bacterium]